MIGINIFIQSSILFILSMIISYFGISWFKKDKRLYMLPLLILVIVILGKIILDIQGLSNMVYSTIGYLLILFGIVITLIIGAKNEK